MSNRSNQYFIPLSPRETEIVCLIVGEHSSKEIAQVLFISEETVKTHRKKILQKLCVRNTAGIVREAFLQNLVGHMYAVAS